MGKKTKGFIAISEGILRSNKRLYEALARGSNDKSSTKSNKKKYRKAVETFDNPIPENNDDGFIEEEPCYFEEDIETYPSRVENCMFSSIISKEDKVSVIDRRIPSFDIKKLAKNLTIISNNSKYLQSDDRKMMVKKNGKIIRKGTFARAIHDWSLENNVGREGVDNLMKILHNTFDSKELPSHQAFSKVDKAFDTLEEYKNINHIVEEDDVEKEDDEKEDNDVVSEEEVEEVENISLCTEDLNTGMVTSTIHEYALKSTRYVGVDQCRNDCYVYAGKNNEEFLCPICESDRFRPCTRTLCKGKGTAHCEHLNSTDGDGIAFKQLFYRPLLVLISDLLKSSRFLSSLRFQSVQEKAKQVGYYSDLMDGDVVQHHLSIMHSKYNRWRLSKEERKNSEEVSLILSEFYDGGQLFKSKTSNFWVLMTQILNLPPTFRGKLGIGMFLSAIYSGKHLEAEKFLFTDMFCEELRLLNDGTELVLKGKRYFIQARLILHTLDTKALEAVVCLQSTSNSKFGCPLCRSVTGVQDGSKSVFIGHRQLLPQNSYLRFLGQSGKCCPAGFYDNNDSYDPKVETYDHGMDSFSVEGHEGYKSIRNKMQSGIKGLKDSARKYSQKELEDLRPGVWDSVRDCAGTKHLLQFCVPCDRDKKRESIINKFLFVHESTPFYWSHINPTFDQLTNNATGLRKILIYRHFDFRPYKPYTRVSNDDHLESAMKAQQLNENNKTKSKKNCNGIQDVWPFDRLTYSDIEMQVNWPFLHAVTGVIKLLILTLLGIKEVKESKVKEIYIDQLVQNYFDADESSDDGELVNDDDTEKHTDSRKMEYNMTKKEALRVHRERKQASFYQFRPIHHHAARNSFVCSSLDKKRCREWLQCIILPKGLNEDSWDMKNFLINDQTPIPGYMKMNQRLKLISCFWDFIIYAMDGVSENYKLFYQMVGSNLRKLQSNCFANEDVDQLSRDIQEMICIWEGVLPLKTCTFILHELVDLVPFIKHFGPPMGVSEFPGERAVGALIKRKLQCNSGGQSFENMVVNRHIRFELRKINSFYSSERGKRELNGACTYSETGQCIYNGECYDLSKLESKTSQSKSKHNILTDYEIDFLIDTLVIEIEQKYGAENLDLCMQKSVVYKLECQKRIRHKNLSYMDWLRLVVTTEREHFSAAELSVAQNILSFKPTFNRNAMICGLPFQSRGSWRRETEPPKSIRYGATNPVLKGSSSSDLHHTFREKTSNSSWCMFQQPNNLNLLETKQYAQINTFFRIQFGDVSLDGLMVASVTARKHSTSSKSNLVRITRNESLNMSTLFVTVKNIYPSRIATVPFCSNVKTIRTKHMYENKSPYSSSDTKVELKELVMISLHPERVLGWKYCK